MIAEARARGMLDTSTVILLGRIDDPTTLPDEAVISAITLTELSVGPHVATDDRERSARQAHLQQAESDFDVLAFDDESARAFGAVAASLRASGRKPATRAYDALIAASAIANGLPLYSCNPSHFEGSRNWTCVPSRTQIRASLLSRRRLRQIVVEKCPAAVGFSC